MANSQSETGHYMNVANANRLFTLVQTFIKYNPARGSLQVPQLKAQYDAAKNVMDQLKAEVTVEKKTGKARLTPFRSLPELATRVVNELESSVPESNLLPLSRHILNKIQGNRIGKDADATTPDTTGNSETVIDDAKAATAKNHPFPNALSMLCWTILIS